MPAVPALQAKYRCVWQMAAAALLLISLAASSAAEAKARRALVVGVGNYPTASGLARLTAPANDADQMKLALSSRGVDFSVDVLKDDEVSNKSSFETALNRFLERVSADDEAVFYFSGHGFHIPGQGNFYLLPDAKTPEVFLKGLGPAALRDLDSEDKRNKRYQEWLATVAVSEKSIEDALAARRPSTIVIIADACRNLLSATKGAALLPSMIGLPREIAVGTFRLYSASPGQVSLDSVEPTTTTVTDRQRDSDDDDSGRRSKDDRKSDKNPNRRETSLFTRVLLRQLQIPHLEFNQLFAAVRFNVREQARNLGRTQVPSFSDSPDATPYYFRQGAAQGEELRVMCASAPQELAQLRYGVAQGSVSHGELERKRIDLAPCGEQFSNEVEKLQRLESQGAGALSTTSSDRTTDISQITDPVQLCDVFASSQFDANRPQGIVGFDVQKFALKSLEAARDREAAGEQLKKISEGCSKAIEARPRVARYKFNLARTQYALATLTSNQAERAAGLAQSSRYYQEAVDLGYVAAYNDLAVMLQNGEYFENSTDGLPKAMQRDYKKAAAYLQRGADQGHVIALYNLGLAYKNGDYGFDASSSSSGDTGEKTSVVTENRAYRYMSQAAELGYVPAMVETALMLHYWRNTPLNTKRVIELLQNAAARGSWDAMYWLGEVYRWGAFGDMEADANEAVVWYARAAEAGDVRSQTRIASMLLEGDGLPAAQPDAAGRYLRLAAEAGSTEAQMLLARRLRDGKISFRPRADGKFDAGAAEIRYLYVSAFVRGKSEAGLDLARLFRKGFPEQRPSDAIPKSPELAARMLWMTIDEVRRANPATDDANPRLEVLASMELIGMYEAGEAKGAGGPDAITADQYSQLKFDYGDISRVTYVRTQAVGAVNCNEHSNYWVMIWDGQGSTVPTEAQFDWFERRYKCKELTIREKEEARDNKEQAKRNAQKEVLLGVPKKTRDVFKREFEAAQKDAKNLKPGSNEKLRTFVDRMTAIVSKKSG